MNDEDNVTQLNYDSLSGNYFISEGSGLGVVSPFKYVAVPEYKACFGFSPSTLQFLDNSFSPNSTPHIWPDRDSLENSIRSNIISISWKSYAILATHEYPERFALSQHEQYRQVILFQSGLMECDYVIVSCWNNAELFKVGEFVKSTSQKVLEEVISKGNPLETILVTDNFDEAFVKPSTPEEPSWENIFNGD